jgi:hypothetical protein
MLTRCLFCRFCKHSCFSDSVGFLDTPCTVFFDPLAGWTVGQSENPPASIE